MKTLFFYISFLFVLPFMYSQIVSYKVVEVKGSVDYKTREGDWREAHVGELFKGGTEIFTGLHSHISFEIGAKTFITVKQLSNVLLSDIRVRKNEALVDIYLKNGYTVVYAGNLGAFVNKVSVSFFDGSVRFEESGGEIYLRKESGAVIESFKGKIDVFSLIKNRYFILEGEMCGLDTRGKLIESDYFLRKNIQSVPADYLSDREKEIYMNSIFYNNSLDRYTGDYNDAFGK